MTATGQEGGIDDRSYIRRLRELLNDIPKPADEQGTGLGNALRYSLQTVPVNDDDFLSVTVGGVAQTVVMSPASVPAGSVFIDFDTGRVIFGTPPPATPANNIVFLKNTVRWRDSTIKEALLDGVRQMFPKMGRVGFNTDLTTTTNTWDYTLPEMFSDANVRITDVAIREVPASANRFEVTSGWERVDSRTLRLPYSQDYSPGAVVGVYYESPYATLSEVEPRAQMLPIWWAAGTLLGFKESQRVRTDTQNVTAEAGANPPGAQQNAGSWFIRQFYTSLAQMSRVRRGPTPEFTYSR